MLAFLSNRATAAHLALGAVAPLVLCKYLESGSVATVLVWMSAVVAIWGFMDPSKGEDDSSGDARRRFVEGVLADPFFWVSILLLAYASIAALNGGVALVYDSESALWKLTKPAAPSLPGGVTGSGGLYFAATLMAFAVYPSVAYSLDSRHALSFAIFATTLVTLDAVFAAYSGVGLSGGHPVAYGCWSLAAAGAMFSAVRAGCRVKELVASVMLSGCLAALLLIGRATVICVFVSALIAEASVFVVFAVAESRLREVIRALVLLFVSAAVAAVLFHWRSGDWAALVPVWISDADSTLTRLAMSAWESAPWVGVGVGGFPFAAKLGAVSADWEVLGAVPDFYGSAWRTLLVERGMIGVAAVAVSVGAMAFAWFRRARLRGREFFTAALPLFPIAVLAVSACMVFDGSALQVDSFLAFVSLAALSVNGGT